MTIASKNGAGRAPAPPTITPTRAVLKDPDKIISGFDTATTARDADITRGLSQGPVVCSTDYHQLPGRSSSKVKRNSKNSGQDILLDSGSSFTLTNERGYFQEGSLNPSGATAHAANGTLIIFSRSRKGFSRYRNFLLPRRNFHTHFSRGLDCGLGFSFY
jgi:hypothetical protein